MLGSARFVVMSMHDQLESLGVIDGRLRMVVFFNGEMRRNNDARRPWENESGENRHRRNCARREIHAREYSAWGMRSPQIIRWSCPRQALREGLVVHRM
jgi:hypothetical protein